MASSRAKVLKQAFDMVAETLGPMGCECELFRGTRHYYIRVSHRTGTYKMTMSGSPRSRDNQLQWVKQDLNQLVRVIEERINAREPNKEVRASA